MDTIPTGPVEAKEPVFDTESFSRETIRKLRARLLDLTTRNPLISFKHTGRARRHVRVIDELPNYLYERFGDESAMRFKSLGEEPSEPSDEKTILFRRALDAAIQEDPEYRLKLEEAGADPGEKILERLQRELRQRVRESLGMPARRPTAALTAADVARNRGLDPAFDLPVSPSAEEDAAPAKHSDLYIQTLLFDEEMDRTLGRIREHVRLSIDEAGVNPLFCVFGFLEWYEDANSETPLHGPLLLYPLQMERELVRGQYQYTVRATGERAMVNVALLERLKRDFEIELPPFDEEEGTPESYLTTVQDVIGRMKGWRIRRWITVGLFSFARIAMYQDLDPARWEALGGLHKHSCLSRIVVGSTAERINADEPDVSDEVAARGVESAELMVPLIADADSSQLGAVVDALSGRNLVIEGPPGTGKSQTITNIIAASLAAGRTVLFLAEKMAALNVVKDRLREAGLHPFCLELHSTKGSRKETFAALAGRLAAIGASSVDTELTSTLTHLDAIRKRLAETVEALGKPAGNLGITVQELLWRCQQLQAQTASLPSEIDELAIPDADRLTNADVGRIVAAAEQFQRARSAVIASCGSMDQHPWRGVARHDIDVFRAEDIVRRVARLSEAAGRAEKILNRVASFAGYSMQTTRELLGLAPVGDLPEIGKEANDELIAAMAEPQTLAVMEEFATGIADCAFLERSIAVAFDGPTDLSDCPAQSMRALAEAAGGAKMLSSTGAELDALADDRVREAADWRTKVDLLSRIAQCAGWSDKLTTQAERALVAAVRVAAEADERLLSARTAPLVAAGASTVLRSALETAQSLRARRKQLGDAYAMESVCDTADLRRHAASLRAAPALPFLSPSWWRARAAYRRLDKLGAAKPRAGMIAALEEIAALKDDWSRFSADPAMHAFVGPAFTGADVDLAPSLDVACWADRARAALGSADEPTLRLRRFLLEGPPDRVEALGAFASSPNFSNLVTAIAEESRADSPTSARADAAQKQAQCALRVREILKRVRLRPDFKLSGCAGLADDIELARRLRDRLENSTAVARVLGARFQGHCTDVRGISECARHVRAVMQSGLPVQLSAWLLAAAAPRRLAGLRQIASEAQELAAEIEALVEQLSSIVPVDYQRWLGELSPLDTNVVALREHSERCASDPEGLQMLIDDARLLHEAREVGLGELLTLLEKRKMPLSGLDIAARRVICQSIARAAIACAPALAGFNGDRYEAYRREFRELDHKLKRLRQAKIVNDLVRNRVDAGQNWGPKKQWTGRALVQNEVGKQQRHIPTRELLDRAGKAVQQLMPCFMMSPLSVAQFLKPGAVQFDLVFRHSSLG